MAAESTIKLMFKIGILGDVILGFKIKLKFLLNVAKTLIRSTELS